jgi:hypothetical protein
LFSIVDGPKVVARDVWKHNANFGFTYISGSLHHEHLRICGRPAYRWAKRDVSGKVGRDETVKIFNNYSASDGPFCQACTKPMVAFGSDRHTISPKILKG